MLSTQRRGNLSCMEHIAELFWVWCFYKCGTTGETNYYLLVILLPLKSVDLECDSTSPNNACGRTPKTLNKGCIISPYYSTTCFLLLLSRAQVPHMKYRADTYSFFNYTSTLSDVRPTNL